MAYLLLMLLIFLLMAAALVVLILKFYWGPSGKPPQYHLDAREREREEKRARDEEPFF